MAMSMEGFSLSQSMKLQQTLAPQMRQGLKMLQMTSLELRAELQHAMETNPVIEDVTSKVERQMSAALPEAHTYGEVTEKPLDFSTDGEMAKVIGTEASDDGYRDYFLRNMESSSGDEEAQSRRDHMFDSMVKNETLQQHLMDQIGLSDIPDEDRQLAGILVENIDDDGYFRGSVPDIEMVTGADEAKIDRTLAAIREFDPPGCGARNLRECWLSQMEKLDDSPWEDEIRSVLEHHFDDLTARRVPVICQALHITGNEYQQMLKDLALLDPMPGRTFLSRANGGKFVSHGGGYVQRVNPGEYVKPEVYVFRDGGETAANGRCASMAATSQKSASLASTRRCWRIRQSPPRQKATSVNASVRRSACRTTYANANRPSTTSHSRLSMPSRRCSRRAASTRSGRSRCSRWPIRWVWLRRLCRARCATNTWPLRSAWWRCGSSSLRAERRRKRASPYPTPRSRRA